jgi:hypothetical protein
MLRKLKWQRPGEPLAARYNWWQGLVPARQLRNCNRPGHKSGALTPPREYYVWCSQEFPPFGYITWMIYIWIKLVQVYFYTAATLLIRSTAFGTVRNLFNNDFLFSTSPRESRSTTVFLEPLSWTSTLATSLTAHKQLSPCFVPNSLKDVLFKGVQCGNTVATLVKSRPHPFNLQTKFTLATNNLEVSTHTACQNVFHTIRNLLL